MSARLTYDELWSVVRQQVDENLRDEWQKQIGFAFDSEGKVWYGEAFLNAIDNCSVTELEELLSGAPIEITSQFIHKLPVASAKRVVKHYRKQDGMKLQESYNRPPQLLGRVTP